MSKAYDTFEWEFIKLVFERLKFHHRWIMWIMECVLTVTYTFLIKMAFLEEELNRVGLSDKKTHYHHTYLYYAVKCSRVCVT